MLKIHIDLRWDLIEAVSLKQHILFLDQYTTSIYVNMFKKKRLGNKYWYLHQFIGSKLHHRQIHGILVFIKDKKKHGTTSEERQSFRKWMTAAVIFITDYCRQFFN